MSYFEQELSVTVDGVQVNAGMMPSDPLVRAVIVSLFTWRRARPDDELPGSARMGWWGDSFASVDGDRIGSRLWLLARAKLTAQTVARAREYAQEALAWLVADGVASRVEVEAERMGTTGLALACRITRSDGRTVDLRFSNVWESLSV
jgi:phage gp46-like protein